MSDAVTNDVVMLGQVSGHFGVKGWLKVYSWTQPRENIFSYSQLLLGRNGDWQSYNVLSGRQQGQGIVVELEAVSDRDTAALLIGADIAVPAEALAKTRPDEYYWRDLVGLDVTNTAGVAFGKVESVMETGANDVLVIQGDVERLVPFRQGDVVKSIELAKGSMLVDWPEDF